jgi:HD-GYP domain-containing protein (c-di-GMP phosphodiesterase class II)
MSEYRLTHAVTDHRGDLLLEAGTVLSREVMQSVAGGATVPIQTCRLMDFYQVGSDLNDFFSAPPYDVIFKGTSRMRALLDIAGEVTMPEPLLESLYQFRELDFYTYRHTLLVFALSILITRELIADRTAMIQEVLAGPVHDIGKRCVPLEILTKETPLTPSELEYLHHHTLAGYVLLSHYFRDPDILAARVARDHHERKDGSGYPLGIAMDSLTTDIIMVSDVYDALISPRPYRKSSYDNRTALEEMIRQAEAGSISQTVVRVLVALNRRSRPHFSQCVLSAEQRGAPPEDNVYGTTQSNEKDGPK